MQQIDHRIIKLLVGLIAVFLAFFMQIISGDDLHSISESYYYRGGDWFVGFLFAVAALFLSFSGDKERRYERILTIAACILAAIVAVAPCECDRRHGGLSALHFPAAISLFAILGYFCWRFRRTASAKVAKYPAAKNRVHFYTLCFIGMLICWTMAVIYALAQEVIDARFPNYVFWLEALGLVSFGFSWLAASRTLPFLTSPGERFSIPQGRAPDD